MAMALDELRSNLYYLCANVAVWIASLAVCVVADVREYDKYPATSTATATARPQGGKGAPVGFDHGRGVWTNAAGWCCAVGGQRPDKPPCGDRTKED